MSEKRGHENGARERIELKSTHARTQVEARSVGSTIPRAADPAQMGRRRQHAAARGDELQYNMWNASRYEECAFVIVPLKVL